MKRSFYYMLFSLKSRTVDRLRPSLLECANVGKTYFKTTAGLVAGY